MVVFGWFLGAVLAVLWLLSVLVAAAEAAGADSESHPHGLYLRCIVGRRLRAVTTN